MATMPTDARAAVSDDGRAMMMFEANRKSVVLAYVLWIFLGTFGAHRFYCSRIFTGLVQLCLHGLGWLLVWVFGLGFLLLVPLWIWILIDAFLIPGWISSHNTRLAEELSRR